MTITGGCLCGTVRYSTGAEPQMAMVCHCSHCRKQSGSEFSVIFGVPDAELTVDGNLATYADTGESGRTVERKFCGTCGSPVLTVIPDMPGMVWIKAGTLDDPSRIAPGMHIWTASAAGWTPIPDGAPQFEGNPGG